MSDFAEFDAYCAAHPDVEPPVLFAQWLADASGDPVVGRELDGDDVVVALPADGKR